ncbi:hypothetical protein [Planomonospora venezuelensis]|uniref:Uncharacterized protein n=1 Tax=Planomonospora venezuelensis TaxID=1999 RepID=A0A841D0W5_PLAVE|nr:hypothetical protein [Planomonospora venezuelensis]MBB5962633.1 hypothetical protein [Planomonospora venezuelensis]GIM98384.1 hypothetical protein Pve01_00430 [Planomonospora venezuelensis]
MRRILLIITIAVSALAVAAPARAGGWAVTLMDPAPAAMRPDTTYTLGFWMLQHGTHPYEGDDLGEVALEFGDGKTTVRFSGVELKEPAHYAAAISLPAGTWKVRAIQGWFAPYEVGTLTVPGDLEIAPLPADLKQAIESQTDRRDHWKEIRPPGIPAGALPADPALTPAPAATTAPAAGALGETTTVAVMEPESGWRPPYTAVAVVLGAAALGALVYRLRRR